MLQFLGKKFTHFFVMASIFFGCSVQAATPAFQEDLDDFGEIHYGVTESLVVPELKPLAILWQNENLSQTLTSSFKSVDDTEQVLYQPDRIQFVALHKYTLFTSLQSALEKQLLGLHQARAPPQFLG